MRASSSILEPIFKQCIDLNEIIYINQLNEIAIKPIKNPGIAAGITLQGCIVQHGEVSYYACLAEPVDLPFISYMSQEGEKVTGNFLYLI